METMYLYKMVHKTRQCESIAIFFMLPLFHQYISRHSPHNSALTISLFHNEYQDIYLFSEVFGSRVLL